MKKGLLIALLALGVVVTAAAGSQHKQSPKPKYQAKADTSFNVKAESFGDFSSMEKMMEDMHKQSRNFFDNALEQTSPSAIFPTHRALLKTDDPPNKSHPGTL